MTTASQPDLFDAQPDPFAVFVHTPAGREIANRFIRLAWGLRQRGFVRYGAKGIVERLRWHYAMRRRDPADYKLNNNWTSRLARFAEEREPRLCGFFEMRRLKS